MKQSNGLGLLRRSVLVFGILTASSLSPSAQADGAYTGRINGEYHGWDGETVYELQDGHIIKQLTYHFHYHYAYSPEVIIYSTGTGSYKIHVIDDDDQDIGIQVLR